MINFYMTADEVQSYAKESIEHFLASGSNMTVYTGFTLEIDATGTLLIVQLPGRSDVFPISLFSGEVRDDNTALIASGIAKQFKDVQKG